MSYLPPSFTISSADPCDPPVTALIEEWLALSAALTPAEESRHALSPDRLADPRVTFFVARAKGDEAALLGCGALYRHDAYLGEVKSMYVRPAGRRGGVARALLDRVVEAARIEGLRRLSLETGADFAPAIALYESAGFRRTGPFAAYRLDPLSVFLTRDL